MCRAHRSQRLLLRLRMEPSRYIFAVTRGGSMRKLLLSVFAVLLTLQFSAV